MLEGKIALVTGTSRGIRRQVALTLGAKGATVVVSYNGSTARAEEVMEEIEAAGGRAEVLQCNASNLEACGQMLAGIVPRHRRLGILVNNAGIARGSLLMKMSEEDSGAVVNTNSKDVFNCIKHIACRMLKQKSGRVVNMSLVSDVLGNAGQANHCAAKVRVIGITKLVAREFASRGVMANAVAPGSIVIKMTDMLSDGVKEVATKKIPMKKFGETQNITNAVTLLAPDEAEYITDQVLCTDGGMAM